MKRCAIHKMYDLHVLSRFYGSCPAKDTIFVNMFNEFSAQAEYARIGMHQAMP